MKNALLRLLGLLLVSFTVLTITVIATGGAGSADDPLITLSYLNEKFTPDFLLKVDEKLTKRNEELAKKLDAQIEEDKAELEKEYGKNQSAEGPQSGTVESFTVVTMTKGQVLYGEIGCEVMLRVGSAECVSPTDPGLIDSTQASLLNNGGALEKNHLYMMTISDRGVRATADTTKVLVRGTYSVN